MTIELALDPADQARYGGPEWVPFDITKLDFVPFEVLDPLEHQMLALWGIGIPRLIAEEMPEETMRAKRAIMWIARRLAEVENPGDTKTPDLDKFRINARRIRFRAVKSAGEGDPPAEGSSSTSSEEKASAKASSRSSRGSGKTPATNSPRVKSGN